MRKSIDQHLNDKPRMCYWQESMLPLDLSSPSMVTGALKDYLSLYKLLESTENPDIRYFSGFKDFKGYRIFHQYFEHSKATETVLITHGYTDHGGLFHKVINYLVNSGRSVIVFDQPGHGLSSGERANTPSFDIYRQLLAEVFRFYQTFLSKPLHVLGQSMGGAIAMDWLLSERSSQDQLGKVILFAPLVRPLSWRQAVWSIRFLSLLMSSIPRTYGRNSEDEAFTHFVRYEDPVQHDRLPAQWVGAMIDWVRRFEALEGDNERLWIIQGDDDQTVDWQYNIPFIRKKFPQAKICMVEGAGHHLAGESERLQKYIFSYVEKAFAD